MTIVDLGTRIRRAREARGLKQAELADLVGVSTTTVRNWETGNFSPRNKTGRIEEVLGISLSEDGEPGDPGDVSLRTATGGQLGAEVGRRLADREAQVNNLQEEVRNLQEQVRNLKEQLAAARLDDPTVLPGPWAARAHRPAPPSDPDEDEH